MKNRAIWTNYKIYAFILGIIAGTLVYNLMGMDFSFSMIHKIEINNFAKSYLYLLTNNIKFLVFIFVISFFKIKNKIVVFIVFNQAFILSGAITMSILSENIILLYSIPLIIAKMVSSIIMFHDSKPILNRGLSVAVIMIGVFIENIFLTKF